MRIVPSTAAGQLRLIASAAAVSLLVVLALQPIYLAALMALDVIAPREARLAHIAKAYDTGVLAPDGRVRRWFHGGGDQFTECFSHGIGLNPATTALQSAVHAHTPLTMKNEHMPCEALHDFAVSAAPVPWIEYWRYWHGYRVYANTMLAAMPLWAVRVVNAVLLAAAAGVLFIQVARLIGPNFALVLLLPALVMTDVWRLWRITSHFETVVLVFVGVAIFAAALRRQSSPFALIVIAAACGSVFNYVDLLHNPPWQPMMFAFLVLATPWMWDRDASASMTAALLPAAAVTAAWFGGYGLTWMSKWALVAWMMADDSIWRSVESVIRWRLAGDHHSVDPSLLTTSARMFTRCFERIGGSLVVLALVSLLVATGRRSQGFDWRRFGLLCLPAFVAILWFETLRNHSQIHVSAASRSAAGAIGVVLAAWAMSMRSAPALSDVAKDAWHRLRAFRFTRAA
jgi:hypothetical protein